MYEAPTHLKIRPLAPHTMLLIARDADYPGWRARVDSAEAAVVAGQAVQVPAGEHLVEMRDDPARSSSGRRSARPPL